YFLVHGQKSLRIRGDVNLITALTQFRKTEFPVLVAVQCDERRLPVSQGNLDISAYGLAGWKTYLAINYSDGRRLLCRHGRRLLLRVRRSRRPHQHDDREASSERDPPFHIGPLPRARFSPNRFAGPDQTNEMIRESSVRTIQLIRRHV